MPLSRLTYVMYLVHLNYMAVYYARARKPIYYTMWDTLQAYFGFLLAVISLAFVICLTVEIPFLNLENLFFSYINCSESRYCRGFIGPPFPKPLQTI